MRTGSYVCGSNHPNYKSDNNEYKRYRQKVSTMTENEYRKNKDVINPNSYKRTLCGVIGGYQLDHILSVYYGYKNKISPEVISKSENLQMLPWDENLRKSNK